MCSRWLLLLLASPASALMYDVLSRHAVPPPGGCMRWEDAPAKHNAFWANGAPPSGAGAFCAQQAKGSANTSCWGTLPGAHGISHGSACPTSYCVSKVTGEIAFCSSGFGIPEQVNVQIAGPDAVVVQFVTFETAAPTKPPVARVGASSGALTTVVPGVTHVHKTHGNRTYYMHFVRLEHLAARAKYFYTVASGGAGAATSDEFAFRAPYADGPTRINLYGDMGVYKWNNMGNLKIDNELELADLVVHAGDHCYNEGDLDEARGDGYMQAFEQTIANIPWMPIVGNHEYYSGTRLSRYLDSTFEKWGPIDVGGGTEAAYGGVGGGTTSATTPLGAFLSAGNHHAAGSTVTNASNSVPSHTSRYFSVDMGLVHLVALSLNGYNGVDTCTTKCNRAQRAWLKRDLAAVDRSKTPWVVAMSHFPLYYRATPLNTTSVPAAELATQAAEEVLPFSAQPWIVSEECEFPDEHGWSHSKTCRPEGWDAASARDAGNPAPAIPLKMREDLEPLFDLYGVDIYWAGHIHFYQTFDGPVRKGKVLSNGTHNPRGVVHVCSGNGGPPSPSSCLQYCGAGGGGRDWAGCKTCIAQPYSYTRLTAHNATDLLWQQYSNADGALIDSWVLHQERHGPFVAAAVGFAYSFQHGQPRYVKYNSSANAVLGGYPRGYGNNDSFPGIPSDLDAAVPQYEDGKSVYFFKGSQYWKYDLMAQEVERGYPAVYNTTNRFPGIPADLDAAVSHPNDGTSVYFFKGNRYWKYDMATGRVLKGYPHTYGTGTGLFPGIPADVDAAMSHWSDGASIFFFKGSQVYKYDYVAGALYPGYPAPFGPGEKHFSGVPGGMAASFNRCGASGPPQFGAQCECNP